MLSACHLRWVSCHAVHHPPRNVQTHTMKGTPREPGIIPLAVQARLIVQRNACCAASGKVGIATVLTLLQALAVAPNQPVLCCSFTPLHHRRCSS